MISSIIKVRHIKCPPNHIINIYNKYPSETTTLLASKSDLLSFINPILFNENSGWLPDKFDFIYYEQNNKYKTNKNPNVIENYTLIEITIIKD